MTSYFHFGELPGHFEMREDSDVARWQEVWATMGAVFQQCVKGHDSAGWQATGESSSVRWENPRLSMATLKC